MAVLCYFVIFRIYDFVKIGPSTIYHDTAFTLKMHISSGSGAKNRLYDRKQKLFSPENGLLRLFHMYFQGLVNQEVKFSERIVFLAPPVSNTPLKIVASEGIH